MWTSWHNRRLSCTNKAQRRARQFLSTTERDGRWEKTQTHFSINASFALSTAVLTKRDWYYEKTIKVWLQILEQKTSERNLTLRGKRNHLWMFNTSVNVSAVKSQFKNNNNKKDSLDWNADILFAIVCIRSSLSDQIQNLTREDEVTPSWSTPPISPCSSSSCTKYLECTCGDH